MFLNTHILHSYVSSGGCWLFYHSLALSITYEGRTIHVGNPLQRCSYQPGTNYFDCREALHTNPLNMRRKYCLCAYAPCNIIYQLLSLCKGMLTGLGLLLLLKSAHHEFICIEPLVDGCMDACSLLPTEAIARPACDALFEGFVGQIVNHGLYHHLLSHLQTSTN